MCWDGPMAAPTIVVIGDTDVGRRTCRALSDNGAHITHLGQPTDTELSSALTHDVAGVAIMLHDDIKALRYALVVEHLRPGIRLFVAIFDRTVRQQVQAAVPNCVVLSPATIAMPSMLAAVIDPSISAIRPRTRDTVGEWVTIDAETLEVKPCPTQTRLRRRGMIGKIRGQFRPYDAGSAVLIGGAIGLLAVIIADTIVGLSHGTFMRALYDAVRTTATISSPDLADTPWLLGWASLAALLVIGFTAAFGAGIVNHLLTGRHVGLIGRRVVPRSGQVIVVGMGQVGLRLAQELRSLGIAVVGIERTDTAQGIPIARDSGIPVLIGDASSRHLLRRAGVARAVALVAAGSEERDNIAVSVAALALAEHLRVVLRAGSDDAIDETRSLFRIGSVIDVNGLTAAFVTESMLGTEPAAVVLHDDRFVAIPAAADQQARRFPIPARCDCHYSA
jgi:Trk K+ transport system NAD-binding subunit